jgi:hypothetical protein
MTNLAGMLRKFSLTLLYVIILQSTVMNFYALIENLGVLRGESASLTLSGLYRT